MDYGHEHLREVMENHNGIASSEQLLQAGYTRMMIYNCLALGILKKESHGNYSMADLQPDEYRIIQCRSDKLVFSHATGLYLNGLTNRVPQMLDVTVPQGDNVSRIKRDHSNIRFHYCKKELWNLGLTQVITPQGFTVNVYDMERCICDVVQNRKNVDSEVFSQSMEEYFINHCDSKKIIRYSRLLRANEILIRSYMKHPDI